MDWRKIGKALLYPHIAIMLVLLPVSIVLLVYSMVFIGTETVIAYISNMRRCGSLIHACE